MDWEEEGKGGGGRAMRSLERKLVNASNCYPILDLGFKVGRGEGGDTRGQFPPVGSADPSGGAGTRGFGVSGRLRGPCAPLQVPACSAAPS